MLFQQKLEKGLKMKKICKKCYNSVIEALTPFILIEYYSADRRNHNVFEEIKKILTEIKK